MPQITGVYAAAVTPRRLGVQDINLGVMWDIIDFLVQHGVDGIVLLGTTGEFVHYSNPERMRMVGLAPKRSRVPILVNVTHSTLDGAVELAQAAAASGAAGVLVMPPYFFRYAESDQAAFFEEFVREADIEIPILLYNIPLFTNAIPFSLTERLLSEGLAHGIKDSSGDPDHYERVAELRSRKEFTFLMGSDTLFTRARQERTVDGVVSGIAAAVPDLLVALNRAIVNNSPEVVARLEVRLQQIIEWAGRFPVPICVREAAAMRGLKLGSHAVPLRGEQARVAAEFREWFKPWLADMQRDCKHA